MKKLFSIVIIILFSQFQVLNAIAGSDGAGTLTVARQAITLNSSTFKEAGDTETADSGIMQQVAAEIASASVVIT